MTLRSVSVFVVLPMILSGCAVPDDYAHVRPRWEVRNSPIPVPRPQEKPPPAPRAVTGLPPAPAASASPGDEAGAVVTVRAGDTVYGLARGHGVDVRDLIAANGLRPPFMVRPGDRLALPRSRVHVVAKGDTAYGISRRYGVDMASLMRINRIAPPYRLGVGQRLRLPSAAMPGMSAGQPPAPVQIRPAALVANGFQWPLEGRVISGYGPKQGGLHNDGINILARRGEAVKAARDGIIAYADDGLKGFGNLLLIRHDDGWITAYAHNERLLVSKGEAVKRGQVIARAGSTGSVVRPQLHFQIRKGRQVIDPERLLPRRGA
ncbi:MAG: peptidoglycan DD-metalloendopeptidase family protein [Pseudomonadota bacterium]